MYKIAAQEAAKAARSFADSLDEGDYCTAAMTYSRLVYAVETMKALFPDEECRTYEY